MRMLILILAQITILLAQDVPAGNQKPLPLEHSIQIAKGYPRHGYIETTYRSLAQRAHPDTKTALRDHLTHATPLEKSNMLAFYYFVGTDAEDLKFLIEALKENLSKQTAERVAVALSGMTIRSVPGVRETLDELLTVEFWRKIKPPDAQDTFEEDMVFAALTGRLYLLDTEFLAIANKSVEAFKTSPRFDSLRINVKALAQRQKELLEFSIPNTQTNRAAIKSTHLDDIIKAAKVEFESISKAWIAKDVAVLATKVANDGVPFLDQYDVSDEDLQIVSKRISSWTKAYDTTRTILEDMRANNYEYGECRVSKVREESFSSVPGGGFNLEKDIDKTVVYMPLKGTSKLREQYLPQTNRTAPTLDPSGNLVIIMILKNGRWHWNPFGW